MPLQLQPAPRSLRSELAHAELRDVRVPEFRAESRLAQGLATKPAPQIHAMENLMGTIVLTTDLSKESLRAFAPTVSLANKLGKKIVLLHVVPELVAVPYGAPLAPPVAAPDTWKEVRRAKAELEQLAEDLGANVTTEVHAASDIPEAITSFAEQVKAEYIALATHGRSGVRRLMMGSVAEAVMRHAKTPILCFPHDAD